MHAVNVSQLHVAEPCGINETEKLDKICYKFYCIDSVIVYNLEFLDRVFSSKISRAKNS